MEVPSRSLDKTRCCGLSRISASSFFLAAISSSSIRKRSWFCWARCSTWSLNVYTVSTIDLRCYMNEVKVEPNRKIIFFARLSSKPSAPLLASSIAASSSARRTGGLCCCSRSSSGGIEINGVSLGRKQRKRKGQGVSAQRGIIR